MDDPAGLTAALERGDDSVLDGIRRLDPSAARFTRFTLTACPGCEGFRLLDVHTFATTKDKQGKESIEHTRILSRLVVTEAVHRKIRDMPPAAPAAEAPPPAEDEPAPSAQ